MLRFFFVLTIILSAQFSQAANLYDTKIEDKSLYDIFKDEGVPEAALQRAFEFMDINAGKKIRIKAKFRDKKNAYMGEREITIQNDSLAIVDFSKPSSERRLYILNLKTGAVSKHFVAHGKGSGVNFPNKFSNIDGSKMSSLGFYLGGNTYYGMHGESLNLYGLEPTNNKAAERDIVIHAAKYVSEDFVKSQGRLGRSWGCPAVAPGIIKKVINSFKEGGVIYAYHKDLMTTTTKNPVLQEVRPAQEEEDIDLPGEEETVRANLTRATPAPTSEPTAPITASPGDAVIYTDP